jgi:hypothetical protein
VLKRGAGCILDSHIEPMLQQTDITKHFINNITAMHYSSWADITDGHITNTIRFSLISIGPACNCKSGTLVLSHISCNCKSGTLIALTIDRIAVTSHQLVLSHISCKSGTYGKAYRTD